MGYSNIENINERPDRPNGPPFKIEFETITVNAHKDVVDAVGVDGVNEGIMLTCMQGEIGALPDDVKDVMISEARNGNLFIARHIMADTPVNFVFHPDKDGGYKVRVELDDGIESVIIEARKGGGDD